MSNNKDEVIKRNIEFMYGRGEKTALADPDKVSYTKSHKFDVKPDAIDEFTGEFEYLSPLYSCRVMLAGDTTVYPSFEHALQASKSADTEKRSELAAITTARDLKRLGGKHADNITSWREAAPKIAEQLLLDKFIRNKDLRQYLMATKQRPLIFKNDFNDQVWGINAEGKGQNMLGKALERVRQSMSKGHDTAQWLKQLLQLHEEESVTVAVRIKRGPDVVQEMEVQNKNILYVGKAIESEVVCENPTVSRRHAVLAADTAMGLVLIDLSSANKTYVNSVEIEPCTPVRIDKKDVVRFGSSSRTYQFILECTTADRQRSLLYEKVVNPVESKHGKPVSDKELTVFVGNLSYTVLESQVREFFQCCGEIASLTLPKDKTTGDGRGIAFVEFANSSGLTRALMRNGDELQDRPLKIVRQSVNPSKDKEKAGTSSFKQSKDYSAGGLDADSYYTRAPGAPPAGIAAAALSERDHITGSRSDNNYDGGQRPAKKRSRSRSPHQSRNGDEGGSCRRHGEGKRHQSSRHQQSSSRSRSRSPNRRDCEKRKYR